MLPFDFTLLGIPLSDFPLSGFLLSDFSASQFQLPDFLLPRLCVPIPRLPSSCLVISLIATPTTSLLRTPKPSTTTSQPPESTTSVHDPGIGKRLPQSLQSGMSPSANRATRISQCCAATLHASKAALAPTVSSAATGEAWAYAACWTIACINEWAQPLIMKSTNGPLALGKMSTRCFSAFRLPTSRFLMSGFWLLDLCLSHFRLFGSSIPDFRFHNGSLSQGLQSDLGVIIPDS